MKLRSRIDHFLAKIAGENVNIKTLTPPTPVNTTEELLLKINDRLNYLDRGYSSMKKIKDYLFEIYYDYLDYDNAMAFFNNGGDSVGAGMCSAVRCGDYYGRNFDWTYNDKAEFIVHTPHANGRYATLGVVGNVNTPTDEFVSSKEYSDFYKVLPFFLHDGINECGVVMNMNVVPTDKGENVAIPSVSEEISLCSSMLVRYVLDNFSSASDAKDYITEHMRIYFSERLHSEGYETHFMIADAEDTFLIEVVDNEAIAVDMSEGSGTSLAGKPYMTNFYLSDVTLNNDGTVYTPADYGTGSAGEDNGITPHGSGLERYNIIVSEYDGLSDKSDMKTLMGKLKYTKAYPTSDDPASPAWCTEFTFGNDYTVDTPADNYSAVLEYEGGLFLNRARDGGEPTWHTVHSAIYDIDNLNLSIIAQEDGEELGFYLGE